MKVSSRKGVSAIVAELLLLAIVVSIGVVLFQFASSGFSNYGSSINLLLTNQGARISDQLVIEQVNFSAGAQTAYISIWVRNVGPAPVKVVAIYLENNTGGTLSQLVTVSPSINLGVGVLQRFGCSQQPSAPAQCAYNLPISFTSHRTLSYSIKVVASDGSSVTALAET